MPHFKTSSISGRITLWVLLGLLCSGGVATAGEMAKQERRYEELLQRWFESPSKDVLDAVETWIVTSPLYHERRMEMQQWQLRRLAKNHPSHALLLAHLELALCRRFLAAESEALSEESLARLQLLTTVHRKRGERSVAELTRLWTALGYFATGLSSVHLETARDAFARAVKLDPTSLTARYGLAFIDERRGKFSDAIDQFEEILDLDPTHPSARLRFALNRLRSSDSQAARSQASGILEELALDAGGAPDWVRILAFQEWAHVLDRSGDTDAAIHVLEGAVDQFPGNGRLAVQLAHASRGRWPLATDRAVAVVESWRGAESHSPRMIYDLGPLLHQKALLQTLEDDRSRRHRELLDSSLLGNTEGE